MPAASNRAAALLIRKLGGEEFISDAEVRAIKNLPVTVRSIVAQQNINYEGGPSLHCCIVLDGWACCYQLLDEGRRQILSLHLPGDLVNLQSLYLPDPDFGMAALTPVVVGYVPHAGLHKLILGFPVLSAALWKETLITAAIHRAWITALGRRDAQGRLAHLFCELYVRLKAIDLADGHTFPMPLRQPDLADATGLTPVHLNRTMSALRKKDLIGFCHRKLEILDWPALCTVAEFNPRYLQLAD